MKRYSYASFEEYVATQVRTTLRKRSGGRRLAQHVGNVRQTLSIARAVGASVGRDSRVVCMGVRRGLEIAAWELAGFRRVVGVELAPSFRSPRIVVSDFADLKSTFLDDSVDIIYANHSFEHSFDPSATAAEWRRILSPHGLAWVAVPSSVGGGITEPSESDPVLVSSVCDIETLFSPMCLVWAATELGGWAPGSKGRVVNLNAVLAGPESLKGKVEGTAAFDLYSTLVARPLAAAVDGLDRVAVRAARRTVVSDALLRCVMSRSARAWPGGD